MAEHRYSVDTALPLGTLWDFVREMDHWAPFLTGCQTHEKRSETGSVEGVNEPAGRLARLWRRLVSALFRRLRAEGATPPAVARMTFHLRIEPGAPWRP